MNMMTNHPNRPDKSGRRSPAANPTPAQVREAREAAGLTQQQAADLIYSKLRTWQNWENEDATDGRRMHPAFFELFLIKSCGFW